MEYTQNLILPCPPSLSNLLTCGHLSSHKLEAIPSAKLWLRPLPPLPYRRTGERLWSVAPAGRTFIAVSNRRGIVLDTREMMASRLRGLSSSGPRMPAVLAAATHMSKCHTEKSSLTDATRIALRPRCLLSSGPRWHWLQPRT